MHARFVIEQRTDNNSKQLSTSHSQKILFDVVQQVQPFYKVQESEVAEGDEAKVDGNERPEEDDCLSEKSLQGSHSDNTSTTHSGAWGPNKNVPQSASPFPFAPLYRPWGNSEFYKSQEVCQRVIMWTQACID
eukprot:1136785-Amphidinium_carterae.1